MLMEFNSLAATILIVILVCSAATLSLYIINRYLVKKVNKKITVVANILIVCITSVFIYNSIDNYKNPTERILGEEEAFQLHLLSIIKAGDTYCNDNETCLTIYEEFDRISDIGVGVELFYIPVLEPTGNVKIRFNVDFEYFIIVEGEVTKIEYGVYDYDSEFYAILIDQLKDY